MGWLFECFAAGPIDPGFISRSDDECSPADIVNWDSLTDDNMETGIEKASYKKRRCPFIDDEAVESEGGGGDDDDDDDNNENNDFDHNQLAFRLPTIN